MAYQDNDLINGSKIAIIIASIIAGVAGFAFLHYTLKERRGENDEKEDEDDVHVARV